MSASKELIRVYKVFLGKVSRFKDRAIVKSSLVDTNKRIGAKVPREPSNVYRLTHKLKPVWWGRKATWKKEIYTRLIPNDFYYREDKNGE